MPQIRDLRGRVVDDGPVRVREFLNTPDDDLTEQVPRAVHEAPVRRAIPTDELYQEFAAALDALEANMRTIMVGIENVRRLAEIVRATAADDAIAREKLAKVHVLLGGA